MNCGWQMMSMIIELFKRFQVRFVISATFKLMRPNLKAKGTVNTDGTDAIYNL